MRTLVLGLLLALGFVFLPGCGSDTLRQRPARPTTETDADPGDTDTTDEEVPGDTDLPEECLFYGVGSEGYLWSIDPVTRAATLVGDTGVELLSDLAILTDGTMIAHTLSNLYQISPSTAAATLLEAYLFDNFGAVASDGSTTPGKLLVGGNTVMAMVDVESQVIDERKTLLQNGKQFAGDFAATGAKTAYATVKITGEPDRLFYVDLENEIAKDLGAFPYSLVWGLDYGCDGKLYALVSSDPPRLLEVQPDDHSFTFSDRGTIEGPDSLWGAAGPMDGTPN